ncbi:TPA: hypothetical protein ACYZ0L_003271 [Escherichia coli]
MKQKLLLAPGLAVLLLSPLAQAMTIHGDIHPDRYTFFLTSEGSNQLKQANDRIARNPQAYTLDVNHTGIQPFKAVRWDSKPVKAVTCVLVDGLAFGRRATWSQCKDETGGEYFGNQGWPVRDYVAKSCQVGASDCPVYLVLQTDPPTMRSDMAQFKPAPKGFNKPQSSGAIITELKARGCEMANNYFRKGHGDEQCQSVENIRNTGSFDKTTVYMADITLQDGSRQEMRVEYYVSSEGATPTTPSVALITPLSNASTTPKPETKRVMVPHASPASDPSTNSTIPATITTKEGVKPFMGCGEYMNCEILAEEGAYRVIQTQSGRDCESGGIWAASIKSGKAVLMPGLTNCNFDSGKNAVVIYPQNGFATVYKGENNATPELATVELPDE